MSETPLEHTQDQEFKPSFTTETAEAAVADETPSWNPEFDSEIDNAASQLTAEALNPFGNDPSWNETQKSFTSEDWAEVRRRAEEAVGKARKAMSTGDSVWAGEAETWRQVALDEQDATKAREEASK